MLAESIHDSEGIESHSPQTVAGLGLLPVQVRFKVDKHMGRPQGQWRGKAATAYEIHHGVASRTLDGVDEPDGAVPGRVVVRVGVGDHLARSSGE